MNTIELTRINNNKYKGFDVSIYRDDTTKYAIRNSSPAFCLVAFDDEQLEIKYKKAIDFYVDYIESIAFT